MSAMIARYLKDFGTPAFAAAETALNEEDEPFGSLGQDFEEPAPDLDTVRREAYAEGHEAAASELSARHEDEMAALATHHEEAMKALRDEHEALLAAILSERLAALTDELSRSVTEATAQVILPFLGEVVARRAVEDLAGALKSALDEGDAGRVKIRGTESMFHRLSAQMGEKAALLDFEMSDAMDLTAEFGSSVLVTRLGAFAAGLEKVME